MNVKGLATAGKSILRREPMNKKLPKISEEKWAQLSRDLFKHELDPKSDFLVVLNKFNSLEAEIPPQVKEALSFLEKKATHFADTMECNLSRGIEPQNKSYYKEFKKLHAKQFKTVQDYLKTQIETLMKKEDYSNPDLQKLIKLQHQIKLGCNENGFTNFLYSGKISAADKTLFADTPVFYHGTKHPGKIAKEGFKTKPKFLQNLFASRELGDGVYLTPDKDVAAFYAGFGGGIVKTTVNNLKAACVNNQQLHKIVLSIKDALGDVNMEQAMTELFKRNGYNAVYSDKGLSVGLFGCPPDAIIGKPQRQLVVFNPKDISVLHQSFAQRAANIKQQVAMSFQKIKNIYLEYRKDLGV